MIMICYVYNPLQTIYVWYASWWHHGGARPRTPLDVAELSLAIKMCFPCTIMGSCLTISWATLVPLSTTASCSLILKASMVKSSSFCLKTFLVLAYTPFCSCYYWCSILIIYLGDEYDNDANNIDDHPPCIMFRAHELKTGDHWSSMIVIWLSTIVHHGIHPYLYSHWSFLCAYPQLHQLEFTNSYGLLIIYLTTT